MIKIIKKIERIQVNLMAMNKSITISIRIGFSMMLMMFMLIVANELEDVKLLLVLVQRLLSVAIAYSDFGEDNSNSVH